MPKRNSNHFDEHVRRLTRENRSTRLEPDGLIKAIAGKPGIGVVGFLFLSFLLFGLVALDEAERQGGFAALEPLDWFMPGLCLVALGIGVYLVGQAHSGIAAIRANQVEHDRKVELAQLEQRPSHVGALASIETQKWVAKGTLGAAEAEALIRLFEVAQVGKEGNLSREHEVRMERIRNSATLRQARERARADKQQLKMKLQNERVPADIKTREEKIRVDATVDLLARLDTIAQTNPTLGERLFNLWQRGAL